MSSLKSRERYTNSIDIELLKKFKELSKETRIPQSRLLDEAIELILKKYNK
jgi:hypothetical protein